MFEFILVIILLDVFLLFLDQVSVSEYWTSEFWLTSSVCFSSF